MNKKNNTFFEGVAYRLGQLQIHLNCIKCRDELHLLEIAINQYLMVESRSHRKEYYRDLGFSKSPSKRKMIKALKKWKSEGNI